MNLLGSCLSVDAIGENPLDMSLLGDGSGHLWWAPGPGQRHDVYSYYRPLYFALTFICLALLSFPRRGNYYEPELDTHLWRSAPIFAIFLDRDTVQRLSYYYLHTVLASTAMGL